MQSEFHVYIKNRKEAKRAFRPAIIAVVRFWHNRTIHPTFEIFTEKFLNAINNKEWPVGLNCMGARTAGARAPYL